MKRTHCDGRAARYMNATSRNDVWFATTNDAASVLEAAQALAMVHAVAEAYLEHGGQKRPDDVAGPVRHLFAVGAVPPSGMSHIFS